MITSYHSSGI